MTPHESSAAAAPPHWWVACGEIVIEAIDGLTRRPARAVLTALGVLVGVAAFLSATGIAASGRLEVGRHFDALKATEVRARGRDRDDFGGSARAEVQAAQLAGIRAAGVHFDCFGGQQVPLSSTAMPDRSGRSTVLATVVAASPGYLDAAGVQIRKGHNYDWFHAGRNERVVLVSDTLATRLQLADLSEAPTIFLSKVPFSVIGTYDAAPRDPSMLLGVAIPDTTAVAVFGERPERRELLASVQLGAAVQVGRQLPLALVPNHPDAIDVEVPPEPRSLESSVEEDLGGVYVGMAVVAISIGALGIANTTLVSVMERRSEIGLRRALGASRLQIGGQFVIESAVLAVLGSLVGCCIGATATVLVCLARGWTPVTDLALFAIAPLAAAGVGILAGAYPAVKAARIEPVEALRQ